MDFGSMGDGAGKLRMPYPGNRVFRYPDDSQDGIRKKFDIYFMVVFDGFQSLVDFLHGHPFFTAIEPNLLLIAR